MKGEINMFGFKKEKISFTGDTNHLISRHINTNFRKGQLVEVPKGYEVVLINKEGKTETVKNVHEFKLNAKLKFLYYSKSNRLTIKAKWGTSTRLTATNHNGKVILIGAHGTFDYRLINAVKFINNRMANFAYANESLLSEMVLSRVTEIFQTVIVEEGSINDIDPAIFTLNLKKKIRLMLQQDLEEDGIELVNFTISDLNIKEKE